MAELRELNSYEEVCALLERVQHETRCHFVVDHVDKYFSRDELPAEPTIRFNAIASRSKNGLCIPYTGIPFVHMGAKAMMCHQGPDKGRSGKKRYQAHRKELLKQDNVILKSRNIKPTKKLDCPAKLTIKKLMFFPDFKVTEHTKHKQAAARRKLFKAIAVDKEPNLNMHLKYFVVLPDPTEHNHDTDEAGGGLEPIHDKVREKVAELVGRGIQKASVVRQCLADFVENDLFRGETPPEKDRRRYYPSKKDVINLITKAKLKIQHSTFNDENIVHLLEQMQGQQCNILYREAKTSPSSSACKQVAENTTVNGEAVAEKQTLVQESHFLFVYQSPQMQRLYQIYGSNTVLLDPTYRTCNYAFPLYFLVVRTNVNYQVVAMFVVQQETKESIAEALQVITEWNPNVIPRNGMADFNTMEIDALERAFPDISVFICDFHREQEWQTWISKPENEVSALADEVKTRLRRIAGAPSEEVAQRAMEDFEASAVFAASKKLQRWFARWKNQLKRWCIAYRPEDFILAIHAINGVERMREDLKHTHLDNHRHCSLADLLEILINRSLPEKYRRYCEQNVRYSNFYLTCTEDLPAYMTNRPKEILNDMRKKAGSLHPELIDEVYFAENGLFLVPSEGARDKRYTVYFGDDVTCCSCPCLAFQKTRLLCKHFYYVFTKYPEWGWDSISSLYTSNPLFIIDQQLKSGEVTYDEEHNFCQSALSYEQLPPEDVLTEEVLFEEMDAYQSDSDGDIPLSLSPVFDHSPTSAVKTELELRQEEARSLLRGMIDCTYSMTDVDKLTVWTSQLSHCHTLAVDLAASAVVLPSLPQLNSEAIGEQKLEVLYLVQPPDTFQ